MPIRESDLSRLVKTTIMLVRVWLIALLVGLYSLIPVFKEYSSTKSSPIFRRVFSLSSAWNQSPMRWKNHSGSIWTISI
jgi:hypothetical protein